MKTLSTALLCMALITTSFSQDCNGIVFTSQAEIDAFPQNYPDCSNLIGELHIADNADITNLNGLQQLTSIEGNIWIENVELLEDLSGLNNITQVTGTVNILSNPNLSSLSGLDNLSYCSFLWIKNNEILANLDALSGLEEIGSKSTYPDFPPFYSIEINDNPILSSIEGLSGLTEIPGAVTIRYCPVLTSLEGLHNVVHIGDNFTLNDLAITDFSGVSALEYIQGKLSFSNLSNLVNLSGLENLEYIYSDTSPGSNNNYFAFLCLNNDLLQDFSELSNLTFIGGGMQVSNNQALINFKGLENLEFLDFSTFQGAHALITHNLSLESLEGLGPLTNAINPVFKIMDNPLLTNCAVEAICEHLDGPGKVFVEENTEGCNTLQEIEIACDAIGVKTLPPSDLTFFRLSPNPATEELFIELLRGNTANAEIRTSIGILIRSFEIDQQKVLSLSGLPSGSYILQVKDENQIQSKPFLVQKH
ncbi:MAG: T9SS type A sorting domain-containing protein [Bacteroidetes bacterium]|nr:T9SS type A sorting domain-containing protein [Bacteroidota bacterium]